MGRTFVVLILASVSVSCGPAAAPTASAPKAALRLDTSSDEAYEKSKDAIEASLTPDEKQKFKDAVQAVSMADAKKAEAIMLSGRPSALRELAEPMNGMTAAEVMAVAEKVRAGGGSPKEKAEAPQPAVDAPK